MEAAQPLNGQHIIQALTAIHTPGATPAEIKIANSFLNDCESRPAFSTTLLAIYCEAAHPQLQMSSLLLLTNVLKRSWNPKRAGNTRPAMRPELKEEIRAGILRAYFLHDLRHYKHFNSLVGFLARLDFPVQFPALHQFILNSLSQLAEMVGSDLAGVLRSNRVLAVLSTCKVVLKEYNHKKIAHSEEIFLKYITAVIQSSAALSQQLFVQVQRAEGETLVGLLECLRKVDKAVLYCLGSMPSLYQYKPETQAIAKSYLGRVGSFNALLEEAVGRSLQGLCEQVEKYLIGIVQQLGRLQNYFPFMFSSFLREYLFLILKMLVGDLPRAKFYRQEKLMSVVVTANIKPVISFAYYMTGEEFRASVYCRQKSEFDSVALQAHCHSVFREVYTPEAVTRLLETVLCEVMTAPHALRDHKEFSDQLVLEDVEIAIVEQVADASVYDNCVTLLKQIVKCFREETRPFVTALIEKVHELKFASDRHSRQLLVNVLEVVLFLPHVYPEGTLPIEQVCGVIGAVYEAGLFSHLSRLIRKYYSHLPLQTVRECFSILARVVATPAGGAITPEIIYQSALGLKTLMVGMDNASIPVEVLAGCIGNIVSLVGMREVVACPTLMWPIINLLIRLVKSLYDISRDLVGEAAAIIVRGLAPLISAEKNEELLVNALVELMATLFYCCFKAVKQVYHVRGRPAEQCEKMQQVGKAGFVLFDAAAIFLRLNMHNRALESNDNMQRFWLSLLRSYPSRYQQQLYGFELTATNNTLVEYFNAESKGLVEDDSVIFLEILEEYFITELVDITPADLLGIVSPSLQEEEDGEKRLRVAMAAASLYFSYSLLRSPVMDVVKILFRELLALHNRISPQVNGVRTTIFLILGQLMLHQNAGEIYNFFTVLCEGDVGRWFLPYLWNMHFVTNKFAFKLNAAVLLKAIGDIGSQAFAQLMQVQYEQQYAIDEFLKIITIELQPVNLAALTASYHNITKALLPNEIIPEFEMVSYRKVRLQLSDPLLTDVARMDLTPQLRTQLGSVMAALNWSSADLDQRIGETAALKFCDYLGWERKIA